MDDPTPPRPPSPPSSESGGAPPAAPPSRRTASAPADRGLAWWTEGWRLFTASPGVWIGITALFVVIVLCLAMIPVLGTFATTLLGPVLAGGIMSGCRALDRGGALTFGHLFAGFADRLGPLVIVGVLYLVGSLVIVVVAGGALLTVIGVTGIGALMSGDLLHAGSTALASIGVGAMLALLVVLLLQISLTMAYWFAPALVMLRNDEPLAAMKASFDASLVNFLPMLVYSVLGLVFAIVATLPALLGWLVLGPVFAGSVYASYKDIFGDGDSAEA